jgi:hypothetical protein
MNHDKTRPASVLRDPPFKVEQLVDLYKLRVRTETSVWFSAASVAENDIDWLSFQDIAALIWKTSPNTTELCSLPEVHPAELIQCGEIAETIVLTLPLGQIRQSSEQESVSIWASSVLINRIRD